MVFPLIICDLLDVGWTNEGCTSHRYSLHNVSATAVLCDIGVKISEVCFCFTGLTVRLGFALAVQPKHFAFFELSFILTFTELPSILFIGGSSQGQKHSGEIQASPRTLFFDCMLHDSNVRRNKKPDM